MAWQITYITWAHLITAIITLQVTFTVYRMRKIRGRISFLWMLVLASFWSLILTFESAAPTIPEKIVFSRFEYFANMIIPLCFIQFILSYDLEKPGWIIRNFWVFWIIPVCTLGLVFTSDFHELIWTGFTWSPGGNNILIYHHGPFFYVAMAYSLGLIVFGNLLMLSFIQKRPRYYKSKAIFLISASIFPLLTGLVYTLGLSPVEGLDISPMGILFAGIIFFWGIAREQLFDIVPAGHQLMIEKMNDAVIVLDNHHFIMDMNPAAISSLQIAESIKGRKLELVLPMLREVTMEKSPGKELRTTIFLSDPINGWFEIMRNPLKDSDGKQLGTLLIMQDITYRVESVEKLKKLANDLTELNGMKDRLYSIIGHDLRSPFNSILGFARLLSESYDDFTQEERKQFASNILVASKSAFSLLENLLEWSKIQLGSTPFSPEELNLNLLINETIHFLRISTQEKNIELINRVTPGQIVWADKNMLSTILRNLISNGIKFSSPGGHVEISSISFQNFIEINVSDSGIGMSKPFTEKLFRIDSLVTTPGTNNEKGTGLGLIICKEFVLKHNGTIRVQSEPGQGTSFIVTLPLNLPGVTGV